MSSAGARSDRVEIVGLGQLVRHPEAATCMKNGAIGTAVTHFALERWLGHAATQPAAGLRLESLQM